MTFRQPGMYSVPYAGSVGGQAFTDAALIFLALPKLYLDRRLQNNTLYDNLCEHKPSRIVRRGLPTHAREETDEEERAAMRAQGLCDDGFVAKGVKALGRSRVLDGSDPEVQKVMDSKHPPCK